jgi:DNA-binding transcriptional LysR family regulator
MIDVRRLFVLRELDRTGTVAAAAVALHLTPSAVSQQLAALARETGVTLVEPEGRKLRLTSAARLLAGHADELATRLEQMESALAAHREGVLGEVTIAAFPTAISALVAPALRRLRTTHPGLTVHVTDAQEPGPGTVVGAGDADIGIAVLAPDGQVPGNERLERAPLLSDPLDILLPEGHPLASLDTVPLGALADEIWVSGQPGSICRLVAMAGCAHAGFTPQVRHNTDDWTAVVALVGAGCGVALEPRLAHDAVAAATQGVVTRPVRDPAPHRQLVTIARPGSAEAPHRAVVLAALRDVAATAVNLN